MIKNTLKLINAKIAPLLLALTIIINSQVSVFAQTQPRAAVDNTRVVNKVTLVLNNAAQQAAAAAPMSFEEGKAIFAKESRTFTMQDYNAYLKLVNAYDVQVAQVYNLLIKEINLDGFLSYAFREANKNGKVCHDKQCWNLDVYTQGLLRARLYDGAGLTKGTAAQYRWNAEIMLAAVPDIYLAYTTAGVHRADLPLLQKYLRFLVKKADDYCDNDTYLADIAPGAAGADGRSKAVRGKDSRQRACQNVGSAMLLLGFAGESGKDKVENAKIIYEALNDSYKDDYGAITLSNGIAALIAVGTRSSYYYIEQFLTQDTIKEAHSFGTVLNSLKWFADLLSIQSWVEAGTDVNNRSRGRGGRYLDSVCARMQYVDEDAARAFGLGDFSITMAKEHPSLGYNVPLRNVFEDVGIMLATTGTKEGNELAAKIVNTYAAALKQDGNKSISAHTALVAGILQTGTVRNANAQFAAKQLNSLDWWDLNEATQRRVNNLAVKYSGTIKRSQNEAKIKRNERNQKIIQASVWADIVVSAVFIMSLVASLPAILKNAATFAGNLAKIRAVASATGKVSLLRAIRTASVKAADIKVPVAENPVQAVKTAEAVSVKPVNLKTTAPKTGHLQTPLGETTIRGVAAGEKTPAVFTVSIGEGSGGSAAKTMQATAKSAQKTAEVIAKPVQTSSAAVAETSKPLKVPFKPKVQKDLSRAQIYKNRNFLEKAVFGDKFFNELSPFKQKLMTGRLAWDMQISLTHNLFKYGLSSPKLYLGFAVPGASVGEAVAMQQVVQTVKTVPSALKTVELEPAIAATALEKAPVVQEFVPKTLPIQAPLSPVFIGPAAIVAIPPQDRTVYALSQSSVNVNKGASAVRKIKAPKPVVKGAFILDRKAAFAEVQAYLKANSEDAAMQALADKLLEQHPALKGDNLIYRGLFVRYESELKDILKTGMDIERIVSKPFAAPVKEITTVHGERSNMCFASSAYGAMSYATGMNMFNRSSKGYFTMVVAQKPADLDTEGIWFLTRSMRADEIKDVLVYDVSIQKWVSVNQMFQ